MPHGMLMLRRLSLLMFLLVVAAATPAEARSGAGRSVAVTVTGELRAAAAIPATGAGPETIRYSLARRGRASLRLVPGRRVEMPLAGSRVRVRGSRRGRTVAVRSIRVLPSTRARSAAQTSHRPRTVAVVMVNFANRRLRRHSAGEVRERLFTEEQSASAWFSAVTEGWVTLRGIRQQQGDVFGWYELSANASCEPEDWMPEATALAEDDNPGLDLTRYDHVVFLQPDLNCATASEPNWAGMAAIDGQWLVLNDDLSNRVLVHELGHNLGLNHAGEMDCKNAVGERVAISGDCTVRGYADPFDAMGGGQPRHFSAAVTLHLGWLPLTNRVDVTRNLAGWLAPANQVLGAGVATQALMIRTKEESDDVYIVETRRAQDVFFEFSPQSFVVGGLTIRRADDPGPGQDAVFAPTSLIDTTPWTGPEVLPNVPPGEWPEPTDQPLVAGQTFNDPVTGISITAGKTGPAGTAFAVNLTRDPGAAVVPPEPLPDGGGGGGGGGGGDGSGGGGDGDGDAGDGGGGGAGTVVSKRIRPMRAIVAGRSVKRAALFDAGDGKVLKVPARKRLARLELVYQLPGATLGGYPSVAVSASSQGICRGSLDAAAGRGGLRQFGTFAMAEPGLDFTKRLPQRALSRATARVRVTCRGVKAMRVDQAVLVVK